MKLLKLKVLCSIHIKWLNTVHSKLTHTPTDFLLGILNACSFFWNGDPCWILNDLVPKFNQLLRTVNSAFKFLMVKRND